MKTKQSCRMKNHAIEVGPFQVNQVAAADFEIMSNIR